MIANNLASLIASNRTDAESLERAYAIARRLRGSSVPQFQDTYGWILHRRGDSLQALTLLAPAAAALPDNALVQFHLAETEHALERWSEARASYARALAAAEAGSPLPQATEARARIAEIDARSPGTASGPEAAPEPAAAPGPARAYPRLRRLRPPGGSLRGRGPATKARIRSRNAAGALRPDRAGRRILSRQGAAAMQAGRSASSSATWMPGRVRSQTAVSA